MADSRGGRPEVGGTEATGPGTFDPRVVIFEAEGRPHVEIVELPRVTTIGTRICHRGTSWRVTGFRTHRRVVICRPAEA